MYQNSINSFQDFNLLIHIHNPKYTIITLHINQIIKWVHLLKFPLFLIYYFIILIYIINNYCI